MRSSILIIILFFLTLNCKKIIELDKPSNELSSSIIFADSVSIQSSLVQLYTSFSAVDANFIPYVGLYVDELDKPVPNSLSPEYKTNTLLPTNGALQNVWRNLYVTVYNANAIVEGIENSKSISESLKRAAIGEAKFIRAYCYNLLVNIFGDVPLITTTDVRITSVHPRTASVTVYQQIVDDLIQAQSYLGKEFLNGEKTRANYYTATALLARVYLYQSNWVNAEEETSKIIGSNLFTPLPSLDKVFLKNNKEAIWQIWNQNGFSNMGSLFTPSSGIPGYILTDLLISIFEPSDNRIMQWTRTITINGVTYVHPYKYHKRTTTTGTSAEYTVNLRAAEQYLIRAEARVHLNNITGALQDLNVIRNRAGLPNLLTTNTESLLLAIANERRVEFFAEGGHRFFDLKRTGTINQIMSALKPLWKPEAALYPIPQNEIINNPSLIQNPGY